MLTQQEFNISDAPYTNGVIKRLLCLTQMTATLPSRLVAETDYVIEISGYILHYTEQPNPFSEGTILVKAGGYADRFVRFLATNVDKVNEQGDLVANGTIGQYDFIFNATEAKLLSPQEAFAKAVEEADQAGKFNQ